MLCNQATVALPLTAFVDAQNTGGQSSLSFVENTDPGKGHKYAFNVTKDDKGGIVIGVRGYWHERAMLVTDSQGNLDEQDLDAGSHVDFEMTIKIPKANFDKLGKADWTKYDHKPVEKVAVDTVFSKEGRATAASLVPDAYKFNGSVHVKVTAHLDEPGNPTKDMMRENLPKAAAQAPVEEAPEEI